VKKIGVEKSKVGKSEVGNSRHPSRKVHSGNGVVMGMVTEENGKKPTPSLKGREKNTSTTLN
jgi:hypothetical protein